MEDPRRAALGPGAPIVIEEPKAAEAAQPAGVATTAEPAVREEFKPGTLAWALHSSASAHQSLERSLRESQERERVRKEKAIREQSERNRFYNEVLVPARARSEIELQEFRAQQESQRLAREEADRIHAEYVASPEGQAAAERARLDIEFFGNPPKNQEQVAREETTKETVGVAFPRVARLLRL